ncbi:uncharacterized protein LOC132169058 [Corylus avellana]|uniref:uncharacterized protein LOC132169058 n=1 Tax=Corylus avellana TaxID=13451 RepID=UPI00286C5B5D|nr:uncharacterized protein LOC132169058 [Corylus avellana]
MASVVGGGEEIKNELFQMAMEGEWDKVVEIYGSNPEARKVTVTRSGDTALHIAVSDGQEEIVKQLIDEISNGQEEGKEALRIRNDHGNTPLHVAASMGSVGMCEYIAQVDPSLVGARNKDSETPFFLAAFHGKKEAFLCLLRICGRSDGYEYSKKKNDGETILHVAIAGDYFDLAFQIIQLYKDQEKKMDLVNSVNQEGFSPLHLLASKPSAFRSGSHLGRYHKIIYHFKIMGKNSAQTDLDLERHAGEAKQTNKEKKGSEVTNGALKQPFPPNYITCFEFVKLIYKAVLVVLGLGSTEILKIQDKKEKHVWSVQIMNELLQRVSMNEYGNTGTTPPPSKTTLPTDGETSAYNTIAEGSVYSDNFSEDQEKPNSDPTLESLQGNQRDKSKRLLTPILIAAKNGITEIVEKILKRFPVAIHDMNTENKNIVLLAVEHRQPHVFKLLLKRNILRDTVFRVVDKEGNSALHLAAKLGEYKPWLIPGAALQMQWEIKWYQFVKESMPPHFFPRYNRQRQTPKDLFTETHRDLVEKGGDWLSKTSESCSVVAALIATVAFATSSAVPGGVNQDSGTPTLENQPAFNIFAIASLVALCFSVTAVVMFLAILTSRYQERDFGRDLPTKLLVGLTSLFVSIASMLISFCAGHFFVLKDKLKYAAFPVYAVTCLPVTFFAMVQFPLYFDLIWATFKKVPQRSYKAVPL